MQNSKLTNYDDTKRMLNTLRKLNESTKNFNILKEEEEQMDNSETEEEIYVVNDVDIKITSIDKNELILTDNHKNSISQLVDSFRDQVSQIGELDPGFVITKDQVRLDGSIPDMDLSFVIISGMDSGIYLNSDMLKIDTEVLEMLDKLTKFESIFEDTLNPIIRERNNKV